jgi:hypothetical protein
MPIAPNRLKDTERSFPISENYRTRASALHALTVIRLLDGGRLVLPLSRHSLSVSSFRRRAILSRTVPLETVAKLTASAELGIVSDSPTHASPSSSTFASFRSAVSNPSVNQR